MKKLVSPFLIVLVTLMGLSPVISQRSAVSSKDKIRIQKNTGEAGTEFRGAAAYSDGKGAWLEWEMAVERSNLGFYVYRIDPSGKSLVRDDIVQGSAFVYGDQPAKGETYSLFDPNGSTDTVYVVEALQMNGARIATAPFSPKYVNDLAFIAGRSGDGFAAPREENSLVRDSSLTLSKELREEVASNTLTPDINTHRWVMAQPGVRIGVRKDGMYRITEAELKAAGFDMEADPAFWQLYLEGNQQAITVGAGGSYIEFYGKGLDRIESDTQAYFLINGNAPGKRIQTRVARPNGSTVVSPRYDQTFRLKERTNYNSQILNGDAENFWGRLISSTTSDPMNFNLSGVDHSVPMARLSIKIQGFSLGAHEIQLTLNGNVIGVAVGNLRDNFTVSFDIPTSHLINGSNALQMQSVFAGSPPDFSFFDQIEVAYGRKFAADNDNVSFYTENNRRATLEGFSSANVRVFDTTIDGEVAELINLVFQEQNGTFGADIPAARARTFVAFDEGAFLQAASIAPNNTEMLSDPLNAANLVIITHKNFITEAETWAAYRQNQGFSVKIVEVQEIYDEFNYGVMNADSIKAFLQMTTTTWATAPGYVLLIGDATTDPRNYLGTGFAHYVPTRMIDTIFDETGSDEFLADFNGDGLAEMAVGRIAARIGSTVTLVFNKTVNWETNFVNSLERGSLFAHDRIDGYNFEAMNQRLRSHLPADMPATMVHRDEANAQANLVAAMNTGKYVVNFSGHGTSGAWVNSAFFANSTLPQLNFPNNESIYTMLTCLNGYFILPTSNSLAENLVHATNGGAVAAWSSTGRTTPDIQELMATRFYNQLGAGQIERIGDLIRDAKAVVPGGSDVRLSWALLGDPMLKVRQAPDPVSEKKR